MEKLRKMMYIVVGVLAIFILFLFILASCNKKKYTPKEFSDYLVDSAKLYYKRHPEMLPQSNGGKTSINIASLVEKQEKYIGKNNICSGEINVTNNNGYYMYSPNISCSDGFQSTKLLTKITDQSNIVTSANGLYASNGEYIFRGEDVNNYLVFNKQLWRIIKINADGSFKIIETNYIVKEKKGTTQYKNNKRLSTVWDDRYNADKTYTSGFNDYVHEGINSRIKDTLEGIYNGYDEDIKGYIVAQNLCIGKRTVRDAVNDGSIECSSVLENQYIGLIQLNEFIGASLDPNCVSAESVTCANYNYLSTFNSTYWTITANSENSYNVYKVGKSIGNSTANNNATPRVVINLSADISSSSGDGSEKNPYVID